MTVVETVLVFVGIPLAVVALIAFAVYGRSAVHQPNRYRPGQGVDLPAGVVRAAPGRDRATSSPTGVALEGATTGADGGRRCQR